MRKRKNQIDEKYLLRQLTRRAYFKQKGHCYHCKEFVPFDQATGDHLVPRYAGGKTRHGNIVMACFECNNNRNKETNRAGGKLNITVGDTTPRSPFEKLAILMEPDNGLAPSDPAHPSDVQKQVDLDEA